MKQQLENRINPYESPQSYETINRSKKIFKEGLALGLVSLLGGKIMDVPDLSFIGYATALTSAIGMVYYTFKPQNKRNIIEYE